MSKEKQIEEMAEVLRRCCDNSCKQYCNGFIDCEACEATLLYNAGYHKQSEWISVDERLPEDKQICLVYGTAYYVPEETESEEIFTTAFYKEFGFVEQIHAHITHWMPLPEAPKGGAE